MKSRAQCYSLVFCSFSGTLLPSSAAKDLAVFMWQIRGFATTHIRRAGPLHFLMP